MSIIRKISRRKKCVSYYVSRRGQSSVKGWDHISKHFFNNQDNTDNSLHDEDISWSSSSSEVENNAEVVPNEPIISRNHHPVVTQLNFDDCTVHKHNNLTRSPTLGSTGDDESRMVSTFKLSTPLSNNFVNKSQVGILGNNENYNSDIKITTTPSHDNCRKPFKDLVKGQITENLDINIHDTASIQTDNTTDIRLHYNTVNKHAKKSSRRRLFSINEDTRSLVSKNEEYKDCKHNRDENILSESNFIACSSQASEKNCLNLKLPNDIDERGARPAVMKSNRGLQRDQCPIRHLQKIQKRKCYKFSNTTNVMYSYVSPKSTLPNNNNNNNNNNENRTAMPNEMELEKRGKSEHLNASNLSGRSLSPVLFDDEVPPALVYLPLGNSRLPAINMESAIFLEKSPVHQRYHLQESRLPLFGSNAQVSPDHKTFGKHGVESSRVLSDFSDFIENTLPMPLSVLGTNTLAHGKQLGSRSVSSVNHPTSPDIFLSDNLQENCSLESMKRSKRLRRMALPSFTPKKVNNNLSKLPYKRHSLMENILPSTAFCENVLFVKEMEHMQESEVKSKIAQVSSGRGPSVGWLTARAKNESQTVEPSTHDIVSSSVLKETSGALEKKHQYSNVNVIGMSRINQNKVSIPLDLQNKTSPTNIENVGCKNICEDAVVNMKDFRDGSPIKDCTSTNNLEGQIVCPSKRFPKYKTAHTKVSNSCNIPTKEPVFNKCGNKLSAQNGIEPCVALELPNKTLSKVITQSRVINGFKDTVINTENYDISFESQDVTPIKDCPLILPTNENFRRGAVLKKAFQKTSGFYIFDSQNIPSESVHLKKLRKSTPCQNKLESSNKPLKLIRHSSPINNFELTIVSTKNDNVIFENQDVTPIKDCPVMISTRNDLRRRASSKKSSRSTSACYISDSHNIPCESVSLKKTNQSTSQNKLESPNKPKFIRDSSPINGFRDTIVNTENYNISFETQDVIPIKDCPLMISTNKNLKRGVDSHNICIESVPLKQLRKSTPYQSKLESPNKPKLIRCSSHINAFEGTIVNTENYNISFKTQDVTPIKDCPLMFTNENLRKGALSKILPHNKSACTNITDSQNIPIEDISVILGKDKFYVAFEAQEKTPPKNIFSSSSRWAHELISNTENYNILFDTQDVTPVKGPKQHLTISKSNQKGEKLSNTVETSTHHATSSNVVANTGFSTSDEDLCFITQTVKPTLNVVTSEKYSSRCSNARKMGENELPSSLSAIESLNGQDYAASPPNVAHMEDLQNACSEQILSFSSPTTRESQQSCTQNLNIINDISPPRHHISTEFSSPLHIDPIESEQLVDMDSCTKQRRRLKKNGLAARLKTLLSRQKSLGHVWHHEVNNAERHARPRGKHYVVCRAWREYSRVLVRCKPSAYTTVTDKPLCKLGMHKKKMSKDGSDKDALHSDRSREVNGTSNTDVVIILDTDIVNLPTVRPKMIIKIFPPWQTLDMGKLGITCILGVTYAEVELLDGTIYTPENEVQQAMSNVLQQFDCPCTEQDGATTANCNFKYPHGGLEFLDVFFSKIGVMAVQTCDARLDVSQAADSGMQGTGTVCRALLSQPQEESSTVGLLICVQRIFCYRHPSKCLPKHASENLKNNESSNCDIMWSVLGSDSTGEYCEILLGSAPRNHQNICSASETDAANKSSNSQGLINDIGTLVRPSVDNTESNDILQNDLHSLNQKSTSHFPSTGQESQVHLDSHQVENSLIWKSIISREALGKIYNVWGLNVTKRIHRNDTFGIWGLIDRVSSFKSTTDPHKQQSTAQLTEPIQTENSCLSKRNQLFLYVFSPGVNLWTMREQDAHGFKFDWNKPKLFTLEEVVHQSADLCARYSLVVKLLFASELCLYIADPSLGTSCTGGYVMVYIKPSCFVPTIRTNKTTIVYLQDTLFYKGQLFADKYTYIAVVPDKDNTEACSLPLTFGNISELIRTVKQYDPHIQDLEMSSSEKELVLIKGHVVGVNEDTAAMWPFCVDCSNEFLEERPGGKFYCEACNRPTKICNKMALDVFLSNSTLSPSCSLQVQLQHESVVQLLNPLQDPDEGYDIISILGTVIGPHLCLVVRKIHDTAGGTSFILQQI